MTKQYIDKHSYQALIKRGDIVNDPIKDNTKHPKYGLWYIEKEHLVPGVPTNVNLKKLNENLQISYNTYKVTDVSIKSVPSDEFSVTTSLVESTV